MNLKTWRVTYLPARSQVEHSTYVMAATAGAARTAAESARGNRIRIVKVEMA